MVFVGPVSYNYFSGRTEDKEWTELSIEGLSEFSIVFDVMGCHDAILGFGEYLDSILSNDFYSVVISGWANTMSVIRLYEEGSLQVIT